MHNVNKLNANNFLMYIIITNIYTIYVIYMEKFEEDLSRFIEKGTCSYTTIKEIKKILEDNNYVELSENKKWNLDGDKYYIIRNDASIIGISFPKKESKIFHIITTHCDTPSLLLKPNGQYIKEKYLQYNIMPYGGLLNYGWIDHPLSLAGRIIIKKDNRLISRVVDFKRPLLIVPSVAIHQKTDSNTNLDLNMQIDLQPIIGLSENKNTWLDILKKEINEEIVDYDLFAYNIEKPVYIGKNNELLISPRIDNLTSVYSSLKSFIETESDNIKIFCSFNNEEIGSLTEEGADSTFLIDTLKRIATHKNIDISTSLSNSFIISSDNTHAVHPNHTEYADNTGITRLGEGVAIVREGESSTNGLSSSIIKTLCQNNNIKYQDSTSKNDISGGSTLSGISLRHVSILSIDIGIGQLAMHSGVEVCSINDIYELHKLMSIFYKSKIAKEKNEITIE